MNPNPKNFTPEDVQKSETALREEATLQYWKDNQIFEKTLAKESPMGDFVFFEGPPTANGRPGVHHVGARSFKDIIPRYKTMRGFNVQRRAGWDTHGLPVELQVEKQLGLKSKKEIETYGVAAYNKKCRESVWEYKDEWEALTDRMGYWLDMKHPYVTYENGYIESLWGVVKKISERKDQNGNDLMYKDFKILPWCTRCGTALSSHELNQPGAYQDVKDVTAFVKFKVVENSIIKWNNDYTKWTHNEGGSSRSEGIFDDWEGRLPSDKKLYFLAWTTTPWTLPGNAALAVKSDEKYLFGMNSENDYFIFNQNFNKSLPEGFVILGETSGEKLAGMKYEPLYPFMQDLLPVDQKSKLENAFQVYAADFVTTTDGTGIVHIAPMYGADDFDLGTKHNLPKFHVVNEEGKYIAGCDTGAITLSGRYVKESDESGKPTLAIDIINDLTSRDLLFKKENYVHSYPHCWRCNTPLLYYARGSWFFRMSSLRAQLLAANENINWEPDHIKEGRFGEWLDNIKDWAISRERFWGTPIPVWETADASKRVVIGSLDDIKKYSKKSGNKYYAIRHGQGEQNVKGITSCLPEDPMHLTDLGREEVAKSALNLKDKNITRIICSPLVRTKETAEIIASALEFDHSEIMVDDRIREIHTGDYQGKAFDWRTYFSEITSFDTKIPGGESGSDVRKRVEEFLYEIERKYKNENILVVTHGVFFEVIDGILDGLSHYESLQSFQHAALVSPIKTAEIRAFDFTPLPHNENYELDFHKPYIDQVELELDGEKLTRTSAIMDVWFDSGAMAYAQAHNLADPVDFDPKPADYISEGVDQTRGWFYTMHAIANLLNDKPTNNYKNVICMGLLMAADGTKMSKSKGNIVSPWEMFEKFGADVIRFWFYSVNQPGDAKNFDENSLDDVKKKVFNPLLNVVSFYEMYASQSVIVNPSDSDNILDQWITTLLTKLTKDVVVGLENYDILTPARAIREFIAELSQWYIRRSRDRFKSNNNEDRNFAIATTRYVLIELSKIMAPFTPFVAEEIWQKVMNNETSVHLQEFPKTSEINEDVIEKMQELREIVSIGLEIRSKENIKVRQPLSLLKVKEMKLTPIYYWIILEELNIKKIEIDSSINEKIWIDTEITDDLKNEGDMRDMVRMIQDMRKEADLMPSDRVVVHLEISEPTWFVNSELQKELLSTVGAESIVWASAGNKVEKQ